MHRTLAAYGNNLTILEYFLKRDSQEAQWALYIHHDQQDLLLAQLTPVDQQQMHQVPLPLSEFWNPAAEQGLSTFYLHTRKKVWVTWQQQNNDKYLEVYDTAHQSQGNVTVPDELWKYLLTDLRLCSTDNFCQPDSLRKMLLWKEQLRTGTAQATLPQALFAPRELPHMVPSTTTIS